MATTKNTEKKVNTIAKETEAMEKKESHAGKYHRFCSNCGKEMWVDSPMIRICDECKARKREENAKKANALQKERNKKLGLVNEYQKRRQGKAESYGSKREKEYV